MSDKRRVRASVVGIVAASPVAAYVATTCKLCDDVSCRALGSTNGIGDSSGTSRQRLTGVCARSGGISRGGADTRKPWTDACQINHVPYIKEGQLTTYTSDPARTYLCGSLPTHLMQERTPEAGRGFPRGAQRKEWVIASSPTRKTKTMYVQQNRRPRSLP